MSNNNDEYKNLINIIDGLELELKIKQEELKERDDVIKNLRNEIKTLKQKIFEFETRIEIFQKQITPSVAELIKKYRTTITNFEIILKHKDNNNKQLEELNLKLKNKIDDLSNEIAEKQKIISDLNDKLDLVPYICETLMTEIKNRDERIYLLSKENELLKQQLSSILNISSINELNDSIVKVQKLLNIIKTNNKEELIKLLEKFE